MFALLDFKFYEGKEHVCHIKPSTLDLSQASLAHKKCSQNFMNSWIYDNI